ncbi:hypothetical protein Hypma_016387 [Hypsizygus marmoreus]|uniref:Prolyl 4-hydroxylase alpha subunit domain-containing protein n=1 Tax=Hypsizygus marmoreus TaxID=39966 RepID=A0A369J6T0_HYPMA|nr:hypothetical protein Hypma_016387 [Hypsizygus marmoreus]
MADSSVTVTQNDFAQTPLSSVYTPFYAKIIDNVFTPAECASLVSLAASCPDGWKPAGLSTGAAEQTVHSNFRNSDRVLVFNTAEAEKIYAKLWPYVEEIYEIPPGGRWGCITGKVGKKQGPTWTLAGVNPRLSFLRYGPGQYFKPHCDGLVEVGSQKSFVTLHLYLNDSSSSSLPISPAAASSPALSSSLPSPSSNYIGPFESTTSLHAPEASTSTSPLQGGATRFWTPDKKAYLDVFPKLGRVLVFQQRMLVHSGEEVTSGVKYTMRSDFMFNQK